MLATLALATAVTLVQAPTQQASPDSLANRLADLVELIRADRGIPGAAMALVVNGEVVAVRGFGHHTPERTRAVDPDHSRFRIASVAKLLVATTVLQQVEAGTLDLDTDIAAITRDVPIPEHPGGPITLRHLLTHTAGLDEQLIGYALRPDEPRPSLGEALGRHLPPRVRAPGEVIAYSNAGYSLAAHAVEVAADMPFDRYAEEELFAPLGMTATHYVDVPDGDRAWRVPGFACPDEGCRTAPDVASRLYPPGLAWSTAADMARFLRFAMGGGPDGVLGSTSRRAMMTQQFTHVPRLPGIGWSWFEDRRGGRTAWSHAGGVPGYASLALVLPGARVGLFVINNGSSALLNRMVADSLVHWLGGAASAAPEATPLDAGDDRLVGTWLTTRAPRGSVERFPGLFFSDRVVVRRAADTLELEMPNGTRRALTKVGAGHFVDREDGREMVFATGEGPDRLYLTLDVGGSGMPVAFEKLGRFATPGFMNEYVSWLLGGPMILLLLWGVGRAGWWLVARRRGIKRGAPSVALRLGTAAAMVQTVAFAVLTAGLIARSTRDLQGGTGLIFGVSDAIRTKALLVYPVALAAVVLVWATVRLWRRGEGRVGDRVALTVFAITGALLVQFLVGYHYLPTRW